MSKQIVLKALNREINQKNVFVDFDLLKGRGDFQLFLEVVGQCISLSILTKPDQKEELLGLLKENNILNAKIEVADGEEGFERISSLFLEKKTDCRNAFILIKKSIKSEAEAAKALLGAQGVFYRELEFFELSDLSGLLDIKTETPERRGTVVVDGLEARKMIRVGSFAAMIELAVVNEVLKDRASEVPERSSRFFSLSMKKKPLAAAASAETSQSQSLAQDVRSFIDSGSRKPGARIFELGAVGIAQGIVIAVEKLSDSAENLPALSRFLKTLIALPSEKMSEDADIRLKTIKDSIVSAIKINKGRSFYDALEKEVHDLITPTQEKTEVHEDFYSDSEEEKEGGGVLKTSASGGGLEDLLNKFKNEVEEVSGQGRLLERRPSGSASLGSASSAEVLQGEGRGKEALL